MKIKIKCILSGYYSEMESSRYKPLADKYLRNSASGENSFGARSICANAVKFLDSLKLAAIFACTSDTRVSTLETSNA